MRKIKLLITVILTFAMLLSLPAAANASTKLDELLEKTDGLEEYLRDLAVNMVSIKMEQKEIQTMIDDVEVKITENEELLEETEEACAEQYESMKKRIKYLYETNDVDYIEALFSSESVADIVNKFSYIKSIVEYDREMLDKYDELTTSVQTLQTGLSEKKATLEEYREEVIAKIAEVEAAASQAVTDISDMGVDVSDIPDIIDDYIDENEDEIIDEIEDQTEPETTTGDDNTEESSEDYNDPDDEEPTAPTEEPETTTERPTEAPTTPVEVTTTTEYVEITTTEPPTEPTTEEETTAYEEPTTEYVDTSGDGNSNDPLWDVARVTYLENGCMYPTSSYRSIYLTACVIFNRAYNWYGGSISAAIFDSGQYATAYKYDNWDGSPLTINDITWSAVYDAYYNLDPNPYYQANGDWLADMGLTLYYQDPVTNEVFYYAY